MVKVAILAKSKEKVEELKNLLKKHNLDYEEDEPDYVISYGGDGMFLISERSYPHIPKVLIRDSKICNNCPDLTPEEIIEKLAKNEFKIKELPKIKATKESDDDIRKLVGVNDIVIRNFLPTEAIRFTYKVGNKEHSGEIIGDGVVVATPFGTNKGSYFHSITRKSIKDKSGLAFNNPSKPLDNTTFKFSDTLEITITRGLGILVSDNNHDYIPLAKNNKVKITLHKGCAKILEFDS